MTAKCVTVFGGSGFIGSFVVEELLQRGYHVKVADIAPSKYIPVDIFVPCDIRDPLKVSHAIEGADIVYNFAGLANLDDAVDNPLQTIELNVMGNLHILEACRIHNVERFVYASSAYAMSDKGSFYGISKLSSEKLVEEYYKQYGLSFTIVRYGSVYGERDYPNNYIYNLLKEVYQTGKIIHKGDGDEVREYIHVADASKLAVDIIEDDAYINEHIILTGVERMKRKELFEMIQEMLGDHIKIQYIHTGYEHHYKRTPYSFTPERSKKLVANPYIDMGQGLLECLKDIKDKYDKS